MGKGSYAKTQGVTWLGHSLTAFNGAGYADRDSPETFVDSYIAWKTMKGDQNAIDLATQYREVAEDVGRQMIENSHGAGKPMSKSTLKKFREFYPPAANW